MVNGPPCTVCGYPLRWFGDQNAWGCDRCQRLFPAAPVAAQARGKSKLPIWLALGGAAIAGAVVAIVLATKGGGGGAGQSSAKARRWRRAASRRPTCTSSTLTWSRM